MKKWLIYLLLVTKMFAINQERKYYLELPLDLKCEAMGSSTIYTLSSILQKKYDEHTITGHIEVDSLLESNLWGFFVNGGCIFNNLSAKAYSIVKIDKFEEYNNSNNLIANFSLEYFFKFNKFLIDLNAMYNFVSVPGKVDISIQKGINMEIFMHFLSFNIKGMYNSEYGNFLLSVDNLLSTSWKEQYYKNDNYLKRNLRVGYSKEFNLNSLFNTIQIALELDNLLMNSIYLNHDEKDYALFRKFHLGICGLKKIYDSNNSLELRTGIKNLFPTFGICFNIKDIVNINYTFTNRDLGKEWGRERKIINLFSINLNFSGDKNSINY